MNKTLNPKHPTRTATVTVTLKANQALKVDTSIITITGLCGSPTTDDVAIVAGAGTEIGATKTFVATGEWDLGTKVLKIAAGDTGMVADTEYVFTFHWPLVEEQNPKP